MQIARVVDSSVIVYADDMVMFSIEEKGLVRGLKLLEEWCEEWRVKM